MCSKQGVTEVSGPLLRLGQAINWGRSQEWALSYTCLLEEVWKGSKREEKIKCGGKKKKKLKQRKFGHFFFPIVET
jgi:hypothetical protein